MINIARIIREFIVAFFKSFFNDWLEDFFILLGIGIIITTTYSINILIGNYLLGSVIFLFGLILAKSKR